MAAAPSHTQHTTVTKLRSLWRVRAQLAIAGAQGAAAPPCDATKTAADSAFAGADPMVGTAFRCEEAEIRSASLADAAASEHLPAEPGRTTRRCGN